MNHSTISGTKGRWKPMAGAKNNGDFISIETYSSYSLALADPLAPEYLLAPDAPAEEIGAAIVKALKKSRFLTLEESAELRINSQENYQAWVQKLMDHYGYKTKRALFKNMMSCEIEITDGKIVIAPWHHEKLEAWGSGSITEKDNVCVSVDAPAAEIGEALLLAFSRCTG